MSYSQRRQIAHTHARVVPKARKLWIRIATHRRRSQLGSICVAELVGVILQLKGHLLTVFRDEFYLVLITNVGSNSKDGEVATLWALL